MKFLDRLYGEAKNCISDEERKQRRQRMFFDVVFIIAWAVCLPVGAVPQYSTYLSLILLACIGISFFDENLFLYSALFMFMRYRMLIGSETVYRLFSYLVAMRFIFEIPKSSFRVIYLPVIFVFAMHSFFAMANIENMRVALNIVIDILISYITLMKVLETPQLFRKFLFAYLLGGVLSGFYGWLNKDVAVDINIAGAGAHTVNRNFGALGDPNFAGLFYAICVIVAVFLKSIPMALKVVFVGIFCVLILQTASLSAILTLMTLGIFAIILKFRGKSFFILAGGFTAAVAGIGFLLMIPQVRELDAVNGLIIRISEKLSYIPRGRWDLLTTDRWAIWQQALGIFYEKPLWGQMLGGSVITVMSTEPGIKFACHNSYIQSLLNFGVLGTVLIYMPLFLVFIYRLLRHYKTPPGYETEDIRIIQLSIVFAFIFFGGTVDFFIDWAYMIFYFI